MDLLLCQITEKKRIQVFVTHPLLLSHQKIRKDLTPQKIQWHLRSIGMLLKKGRNMHWHNFFEIGDLLHVYSYVIVGVITNFCK